MKMIRLLFLSSLALSLGACSSTNSDPSLFQPEMNPAQLMDGGVTAISKREYHDASHYFDALSIRYPASPLAGQAQLYSLYVSYISGDYPMAMAQAGRYIDLYPTASNVIYAYYIKGLSNFNMNLGFLQKYLPADLAQRDLTSWKTAFNDFSVVVSSPHPNPYKADARQHMVYIRNLIAEHELKVAQFYYDRRAYVPPINRAQDVVSNYGGSSAVHAALTILENAYRELGETDAADQIARVIAVNQA